MRLVYIALGWVAGMVLAANNPGGSLLWLILAGVSIFGLSLAWRNTAQRWLMIALLALTLGGLRMSLVPTRSDVERYNNTGGLTLEGQIVTEPDQRDDRVLLRVAADTITQASQTVLTNGLVLIQAPTTTTAHYGDRITATGLLVTPAEGDTFSYADFLARGGVFSLMPSASIQVVPDSWQGNPLYAALLDLKTQAQRQIAQFLPEPEAGLLTGILLGSEQGIAPEVADAFGAVGAAHVIAISGFNMSILSHVVVSTLERFRVRPRWAAFFGILVIALYTLFVGASAAVVRAAIMSSLLVIGTVIKRKTFVPASLALVTLLISLQNPTALWDVGFQLSLFATLGLALFADPITRVFNRQLRRLFPPRIAQTAGDILNEPLAVTLAVLITTLPLTVLYFGRLSLLTIIVNLLIVPVQAAILLLGIAGSIVAFFVPVVAQIIFWIDWVLLTWTINVVRLFARLPFAQVDFKVDSRLIALFFMLLIGGAVMQATQPTWALRIACIIRRRSVLTATAFTGLALFALMGAVTFSRPDGNLHVWMLDMGHSNAVFAETPGGAHILVDGGRFPSRLLTALGERMPFTDRTIEVLVISQPDDYDTSALRAVLDRYDVGVTLTSGHATLSEAYAALQGQLAEHELLTVQAGYTLTLSDGTRLEVLHPQEQPTLSDSFDDQTLTVRLTYGDISFLLTSDLSPAGQNALLEAGIWPLATVMQLPQHGAVRSLDTPFLQAVQSQTVVLESDRANRNGDPNADTLALIDPQVPLWRTDTSGTIHLWTDGRGLWADQPR